MMYMMTEAQHAQIVDALSVAERNNPDPVLVTHFGMALAMLKAMQPVLPVAWQRKGADIITAEEKRPDYAYTLYYDTPLYTPAKD